MEENIFWPVWGATISLCGWKVLEAFLQPKKMLEWPFLVSVIWAYFYGYMAYDVKIYLADYLPRGSLTIGVIMPFLALVGVISGWNLGRRSISFTAEGKLVGYNLKHVGMVGLGLLGVGIIGANVFSGFSGIAVDFENTSAYSYLTFYLGYPGLILAVWAASQMSGMDRMLFWLLIAVGIAGFMFPFLTGGRRGPLFPTAMILLLVTPLANRRNPNPVVFFAGVIVTGVIMLLCLQVRLYNQTGQSWGSIIQSLDVSTAVTSRGVEVSDNEYLNNCLLHGLMETTGKYQFGTGHLGLLVHWIPRSVWPNKPMLGEGFMSFDELFADAEGYAGFRVLGGGAAAGGVADSFIQYGYLTPFFWFGLSWLLGRVFARASLSKDARWQWVYVGVLAVSHWLISQSVAAAFVPGTLWLVVLISVSAWLGKVGPQTRVSAASAA